jgi:hypothetical protein
MPGADPFRYDLYICQVSEFDPDGFLLCQADEYGEEGGDSIEVLSPGGTRYRPRSVDANTGAGCPMIVTFDGGKRFCMPSLDTRAAQKLPTTDTNADTLGATEGSMVVFADTGEDVLPMLVMDGKTGFIRLARDDSTELSVDRGAVTMYTTEDRTETGRPVFFTVRDDGFRWESPYGRASITTQGINFKHHGGARLDMGAMGMPSPLSVLGTFATLTAATINLRTSVASVGPSTMLKDAVALSTPVVAYVTAMQAFLTALIAGCHEIALAIPISGEGAAAAFDATVGEVMAALTSAATALALEMPSKSLNAV